MDIWKLQWILGNDVGDVNAIFTVVYVAILLKSFNSIIYKFEKNSKTGPYDT